ncbi:hypothetical protein ABPG72_017546 [Tetrahymena utriculariae]
MRLTVLFLFILISFVSSKDQQRYHVSLVLGPCQSGKDTFIWNIDKSLLYSIREDGKRVIKIGNGDHTETLDFYEIPYTNDYLIPEKEGIFINTVGFNDSRNILSNEEILNRIILKTAEIMVKYESKLDTIYIIQSAIQTSWIQYILTQLQKNFGQRIMKNVVIIVTQASIYPQKWIENKMIHYQQMAQDFQIGGGVIDFRDQYLAMDEKGMYQINFVNRILNSQNSYEELHDFLRKLKPFYLSNYALKYINYLFAIKSDNSTKFAEILQKKYSHFSVAFGCEGGGKDTLIYNFDQSAVNKTINQMFMLKLGNQNHTQTQRVYTIPYENNLLIKGQNGFYINTIGIDCNNQNSQEQNVTESQTITETIRQILNLGGRIDTVYIVQSLLNTQHFEKLVKILKVNFGPDILNSTIVVSTFGNQLINQTNKEIYNSVLNNLQEQASLYGIEGGVVDFLGYYFQNKELIKDFESQINEKINLLALKSKDLPYYSFTSLEMSSLKKLISENNLSLYNIQKIFQSKENTDYHISLFIGRSQSGKDTMICNLDPSVIDLKDQDGRNFINFGNLINSQTKEFQAFYYKNKELIPGQLGIALNTIGFTDSEGFQDDPEIAGQLLSWIIRDVYKIKGRIDSVYILQALDKENIVEKCIQMLYHAFGEGIFNTTVIVATFGNLYGNSFANYLDSDYRKAMDYLHTIEKKYKIAGGVVDFRGFYKQYGQGQIQYCNQGFEGIPIQILANQIKKLQPFYLDALIKDIMKEIKQLTNDVMQEYKRTKEIAIPRVRRKTRYIGWCSSYDEIIHYTDYQYEEYFSKTTAEAQEIAEERLIQRRIQEFKKIIINQEKHDRRKEDL